MKRTLIIVLTAAVIAFGAGPLPAHAWESIDESEEISEEEDTAYASRIAQEKAYLLQALDQMQEWGLSPIAIMARITGDDSVLTIIESASGSVGSGAESVSEVLTDAGTQAVEDITESVTEAVTGAVEEQTEKVKQSILEQIRTMVNDFLDGL